MGRRKLKQDALLTQGVELIEQVISAVQREPHAISGFCGDYPLETPTPMPADTLATLTFPSGKPLPPSLRRWLAFDTSWLSNFGWFDKERHFTPRRLDEIVRDEFDELWGEMYQPVADRTGECFLLPGGSDSRRIYAVTEPDSLGEYPVLVIDTDDLPFVGVMYPGFDIFMGDEAGLDGMDCDFPTYEGLFDDPRYAKRLREHARILFNGHPSIEIGEEEWGGFEV
ncbi:MAG TPA: hypothetical protein VKQ36_16650 [Ktedonobacterales bacterium]|nr:hypothetical protein [Ktedonobacterales bacterium]